MIYAFNTVYVAIIKDGRLVTETPIVAVYDEKTDTWVNKLAGLKIEWLGEVATLWGDAGDERYFSSYDLGEVNRWVENNLINS